MQGTGQFHVACPNAGINPELGRKVIPMDFQMNSEQITGQSNEVPQFAFIGRFASKNCCLDEPFDGYLTCIL